MLAEIGNLILECLKLAPRYIIAIGLVAGMILFGPDNLIKKCGLAEFAQNYRSVLGIAFLGSIALGCIGTCRWIFSQIQSLIWDRKVREHITKRLHSLTEDEKQILRYYIVKQTRANTLRADDGVVQGLVSDHIIYMSASLGSLVEGFAHNINDIAWDYLNEHRELLDGSTNYYRTDKRELW